MSSKPSPRLRVCIYAQHLLGGGHLVRMQALAACLSHAGHRVSLISGGVPRGAHAHRYRLLQLPAVKVAPGDFATLLDRDGAPISANFKARRAARLWRWVAAEAPDVLVVETFPFGRRQLRFELVELMRRVGAMQPRPLRLCSLRDILQLRAAERQRQSVHEVNAWFDAVLVHADPAVVTLAETFPLAAQLHGEGNDKTGDKLFHSGYLYARAASAPLTEGRGEVIVSAGGGAVGLNLLQTAIAAKPRSALKDRVWRLLLGGHMQAAAVNALRAQAGDGVIVQSNRPDFAALLAGCAASVSQAGYNTVLDIVAAGCGAVLTPFAQYGETEQTFRAEKFAALGRAVLLPEDELDAPRLAAAVDRAAQLDLSGCRPINLDGGLQSTRFVERRAREMRTAQTP